MREERGFAEYIKDDKRWVEAVFACLDKIEEIAKTPDFTIEDANIVRILAETAKTAGIRRLKKRPAQQQSCRNGTKVYCSSASKS